MNVELDLLIYHHPKDQIHNIEEDMIIMICNLDVEVEWMIHIIDIVPEDLMIIVDLMIEERDIHHVDMMIIIHIHNHNKIIEEINNNLEIDNIVEIDLMIEEIEIDTEDLMIEEEVWTEIDIEDLMIEEIAEIEMIDNHQKGKEVKMISLTWKKETFEVLIK